MKYLVKITSFDDLKKTYREFAMKLHPDMGGSDEEMQELNREYDQLFPVWKVKAKIKTVETADTDRHQFYTQNGWAGKNYKLGRSTKDVANIIRTYVKERFSDCKFSVSCSYASMCSSLYVYLMEAPFEALEKSARYYDKGHHDINQYHFERDTEMTPKCKAMMKEVLELIKSYHFDDSDSMIDYFDTNFYYTIGIGKWDKPFKVVARKAKTTEPCEYEFYTEKVKKQKKVLKVEPLDVMPNEFAEGMYLRPRAYFSGQIHKDGVYQIKNVTERSMIAYWTGRQMKNLCTGNTPGNALHMTLDYLRKCISKGSMEVVRLVDGVEEYEVEVTKKRKVKKNAVVA